MRRILLTTLWVIFLMTGLTGCSGMPVYMRFHAAKQLNLDPQKRPLSVEVRVYQLSDDGPFKEATFYELWQHDHGALGESLLERRTLTVRPGEKTQITLHRRRETAYLGVLAIFRSDAGRQWRVMQPITSSFFPPIMHLDIDLRGNKMVLES